MTRSSIDFPFFYTYQTRIKNYRGLLGYLALEVAPLVLVAGIYSERNIINVIILYLFYLNIYEIGYLFNDFKDRATSGELNRIGSNTGTWWRPAVFRLLLALALIPAVAARLGWRVADMALGLNVLLLFLLFLHSSSFARRHFPGRILTFSALSIYKYATVLIPVLGFADASFVLLTIFLFYGLPRIMVYMLRKFGQDSDALLRNAQLKIQLGMSIIFLPVVFMFSEKMNRVIALQTRALWAYFGVIAVASLLAWFVRQKIIQPARLAG